MKLCVLNFLNGNFLKFWLLIVWCWFPLIGCSTSPKPKESNLPHLSSQEPKESNLPHMLPQEPKESIIPDPVKLVGKTISAIGNGVQSISTLWTWQKPMPLYSTLDEDYRAKLEEKAVYIPRSYLNPQSVGEYFYVDTLRTAMIQTEKLSGMGYNWFMNPMLDHTSETGADGVILLNPQRLSKYPDYAQVFILMTMASHYKLGHTNNFDWHLQNTPAFSDQDILEADKDAASKMIACGYPPHLIELTIVEIFRQEEQTNILLESERRQIVRSIANKKD